MFRLCSRIEIGGKKFEGVNEVKIERSIYDLAVAEGTMVTINSDSELKQLSAAKELQGMNITTYNNGKNESPDTE